MILQLIVDDGVASRSNRGKVFNPDWTHVGVSCGCHSLFGDSCCVAFAEDIYDSVPSVETLNR